jgi:hypothetical protein
MEKRTGWGNCEGGRRECGDQIPVVVHEKKE